MRKRLLSITNPNLVTGLFLFASIALVVLIGPASSPFDPLSSDVVNRFAPPFSKGDAGQLYILGTDSLGRDIFSRLLFGARISFQLALSGLLIAMVIGITLGFLSGMGPSWLRWLTTRIMDVQLAVPFVILALAVATIFEPSAGVLIAILALISWVNFARISRGLTLQESNQDYVKAAKIIGCSPLKISIVYVFPNVFPHLLPIIILQFAALILFEATLSYLGVGLRPPTPSWGGMMLEGQPYMRTAWWVTVMPGAALFLTTFALNLVSEGIRNVIDPRWQQ